jgi:hypothetical protein
MKLLRSIHNLHDFNYYLSRFTGIDIFCPRSFSVIINSSILHISSTVQFNKNYYTLKINHNSPKSEIDLFLLYFARLSCTHSVLTGEIVRKEPQLTLTPNHLPNHNVFLQYRREILNLSTKSPHLLVLTGKTYQQLDANNNLPIFAENRDNFTFANKNINDLLDDYTVKAEKNRLLLEAGPNTTQDIYKVNEIPRTDLLFLSVYMGSLIDEHNLFNYCVQKSSLNEEILSKHFNLLNEYQENDWSFRVYQRKSPGS